MKIYKFGDNDDSLYDEIPVKFTDKTDFKPDIIESKDVIVIGNGPSAITLSFILSGRWPYYLPNSEHPIEYLHNRLLYCTTTSNGEDNNEKDELGKSLLECDLDYLSNGLTGRSLNRLSILFDQLQNPNVDFGDNQPTTLKWHYRPEKAIDHLILGTGLPGGIWYKLAKHRRFKNILTVSRKKWMQLPDLDIRSEHSSEDEDVDGRESNDEDNNGGGKSGGRSNSVFTSHNRITFQSASEYYRNYVDHFELGKYFRNHTKVVGVEWNEELNCFVIDALCKITVSPPPTSANSASTKCSIWNGKLKCLNEIKCLYRGNNQNNNNSSTANNNNSTSSSSKCVLRIRYLAKKMILATGNSSFPIMLNIPGENFQFVIHSLDQLDGLIKSGRFLTNYHRRRCSRNRNKTCSGSSSSSSVETVLVIGSGLSAADAITTLTKLKRPIRIVHIFRRSINDRQLIFNQLDNSNIYPDYQKVYHAMRHSTRNSPLCLSCLGNRGGGGTSSSQLSNNNNNISVCNNHNFGSVIQYQAYDRCQLTHLSSSRIATLEFLENHNNNDKNNKPELLTVCSKCHQPLWHQSTLKIGLALILVGSKPELDFLSEPIRQNLGRHRSIPIDTRHNPISIDTTTHESISVPNLYAIGPLVGDNFVRFVQGGALAVASHIVQQGQIEPINNNNSEPIVPNNGNHINTNCHQLISRPIL